MPLTITRIPEPYSKGLAKIKNLPFETIAALVAALEKSVPTSSIEKLSEIVQKSAEVTPEEATSMVSSLRSLYVFKAMAEAGVPEVVTKLVSAMQTTGGTLALSDLEKTGFADKLTRLLSMAAFERNAKVEQLKTDRQILFHDAKILTDLRPVFDQPGERPVGAIIINTLKVVIHEAGAHKELYFALDSEDLSALKRVTERAMDKTNSLKDFLKSANIPDLS